MINKWLALLLCLGLTGCAPMERFQLGHEYATIYGSALNAGDITIIGRNEDYQKFKQRLSKSITSYGYTSVIYEDPKHGFVVLAKEENAHPSRIILKYTATQGVDNIRLDLVKGSDDLSTNIEVRQDIREIAGLLRNE
jgi:hypothetical protein